MIAFLDTAGVRVAIDSAPRWVDRLIAEAVGPELQHGPGSYAAVHVRVTADRRPFDVRGWRPVTRGAWAKDGDVVVENVCASGFDLHVRCDQGGACFVYRWRPPARERLAARVLRSRFHLLARAVLVQYPALWWAALEGRAPLHASVCGAGTTTPLVSSPGGIGRSTLLARELDRDARTTGDNLAVGDGRTVWGLVEPLRIEGGNGRRMPHGRREVALRGRATALTPDVVIALERGGASRAALLPCSEASAARALTTSTYMAGELRRFWAFAATLSSGTGLGPAHPPVEEVSRRFAAGLPCFRLVLGRTLEPGLSELLSTVELEVEAWT